MKVLVIEDDETVVDFLVAYLEDEGFEVETATDGLAGLLKLRSSGPDLALVDVMMPDVDGVRLLEQLLEEGGGQLPVPVIVVTGSQEGAVRCRQLLGTDRVFLKPFEPAKLLRSIRKVAGETSD